MKKFLSAILSVLILSSLFTACTTDNKAETKTETQAETPKELPSAVDLRNYNGKNYVTPIKRQALFDCWAFGIACASETSYLYANDMGVPAGEVNDKVNFSEKYMIWYVYNHITNDDVKLGKVRSSQVGEGYTVSEEEPDMAYYTGGAIYSGSNLFASGFEPVDESVSINGETPYFYGGKYSEVIEGEVEYYPEDDWSLPLNAQYRNPETNAIFRESVLLPSPASYDSNGVYSFNEEGVTAIKTEIANCHGVAIAALFEGMMNQENFAIHNRTNNANHVVTIVGYDDNYPKENFAMTTIDGEYIEGSIPPADGAFLIKNSEGVCGIDGSGYYYMSYYDQSISYPISFHFDKTDSAKYKNLNYDQYDMLMIGWCGHSDFDNEAKMANVFDAEEDEFLYQIEYKTTLPDTSVHYEIYKNPDDNKPDSGTLLEQGDTTHKWGGYHKIDLHGEYELKKGEKYSVVLTMTYNDNGTTRYTDVIPYGSNLQHNMTVTGIINKSESYRFADGKWSDITDIKNSLAQQAYNANLAENLPNDFKAQSIADISVDNYPIKAILVPKSEHK